MTHPEDVLEVPGAHLELDRAPGHWLPARMGKRVLRPGGLELTNKMLDELAIGSADRVVEFAPGLGTTTRLVLARAPACYVSVERDAAAARATERVLRPGDQICQGVASDTGLESASATVVFGEAMLTMHTAGQKNAIIREAYRVLRPGGRYAIHELALTSDVISEAEKAAIQRALSHVIHVGARPLTVPEWRSVVEEQGFEILSTSTAPMHLLEPARLVADEGVLGAVRIVANVLRTPAARRRVFAMRSVFRKYATKMCSVALIAKKKAAAST